VNVVLSTQKFPFGSLHWLAVLPLLVPLLLLTLDCVAERGLLSVRRDGQGPNWDSVDSFDQEKYQTRECCFPHWGQEEGPCCQAHACCDFFHGRLNVVDGDRFVVLGVEKDSIVRIAGQGRRTAGVASCIAGAAIATQEPVVELEGLLSVAEGRIVPLSLADEIFENLRIKGVYSLGLLLWAI